VTSLERRAYASGGGAGLSRRWTRLTILYAPVTAAECADDGTEIDI